MKNRRPSQIVWLAAFAALAASACATTQPAAEPAMPSASSAPAASAAPTAPASSSATTAATAPMTPPPAFAICGACHGTTADAPPGLGPNLHGVVGRKAGSLPDYDYSDAMKASGKVWTVESLQAFVTDPGKAVPGNKMDYDGADPASAKAVAEYMASLK
jgi:cytochrome c2